MLSQIRFVAWFVKSFWGQSLIVQLIWNQYPKQEDESSYGANNGGGGGGAQPVGGGDQQCGRGVAGWREWRRGDWLEHCEFGGNLSILLCWKLWVFWCNPCFEDDESNQAHKVVLTTSGAHHTPSPTHQIQRISLTTHIIVIMTNCTSRWWATQVPWPILPLQTPIRLLLLCPGQSLHSSFQPLRLNQSQL